MLFQQECAGDLTFPVFNNCRINSEISQEQQLSGSLTQARRCLKYLCFNNQSYTTVETQKTWKISVKLLKQEACKVQLITLVIALNLQNVISALLARSSKCCQYLTEDYACLSLSMNSEQQPPVTEEALFFNPL